MAIRYSKHAREQMVTGGISETEVEEAVKRGSKELQGRKKVLAYYRYFCVVYLKIGDDIYVITVKPR